MRVTLISKACIVAAYQTKLERMAAYEDIELTAIVPPHWGRGEAQRSLERAHTEGYELVVAPIRFSGWFHWHYYPTLARLLRRTRPDLVHIDEEPYNLATYLALRAALRVGAQALFFTWQNLVRRYPPPFGLMERYVYQHSAGAIAGSRDAAQVLRHKGYAGPIATIPQFGVDPQLYAPQPRSSDEDLFAIGYIGRLVEEKGLWVLAEALSELDGDWRAILVGTGPLRHQLALHFAAQGRGERIEWVGQVPSEDVSDWLQRMDVLILPSLTRSNWKEQFGRVLVEAMACGVPVIGSDSGEIPNVIGEAGLIVPEGHAAALRNAVGTLRDDEVLRRRLSRKGRQRVLNHYTQQRIAEQTVAAYRHMLGQQSAGSIAQRDMLEENE